MVMKFECKVKFGKHLKCVTFLVPLPLWYKKQRKRTLMKITPLQQQQQHTALVRFRPLTFGEEGANRQGYSK